MVWSRVFLLWSLLSCLVLFYFLTYKLIKVCFNYEARDALKLTVVQRVTNAVYSILTLASIGSRDVLTDSIFITAVCSFSTLVYILSNKKCNLHESSCPVIDVWNYSVAIILKILDSNHSVKFCISHSPLVFAMNCRLFTLRKLWLVTFKVHSHKGTLSPFLAWFWSFKNIYRSLEAEQ